MKKQVVVRYGPDGEIEIEAIGYKGKGCKEATKFLEDLLGEVTNLEEKAEWWQRNGAEVRRVRKKYGIRTDKLCG